MASACKCDRCDRLYEPEFGTVNIEQIYVRTDTKGTVDDSWSDIDLCPKCSALVLDILEPALNELIRPST